MGCGEFLDQLSNYQLLKKDCSVELYYMPLQDLKGPNISHLKNSVK